MVTFGSVHKEQSQEIAFSVQILHNFQTQGIRVRDMMRAVLVVVTLLLFLPMSAVSLPAGVGSVGDSGCSCHGGVSAAVTVNLTIDGLPTTYVAGQAYVLNVTLSTTSDDQVNRSSPDNGAYRGFRMTGAGEFTLHQNATGIQVMDGGLTHTTDGSRVNSTVWEFGTTWVAPNSTEDVSFAAYSMLSSGGDGAGGDVWATSNTVTLGAEQPAGGGVDEEADGSELPGFGFAVACSATLLAAVASRRNQSGF